MRYGRMSVGAISICSFNVLFLTQGEFQTPYINSILFFCKTTCTFHFTFHSILSFCAWEINRWKIARVKKQITVSSKSCGKCCKFHRINIPSTSHCITQSIFKNVYHTAYTEIKAALGRVSNCYLSLSYMFYIPCRLWAQKKFNSLWIILVLYVNRALKTTHKLTLVRRILVLAECMLLLFLCVQTISFYFIITWKQHKKNLLFGNGVHRNFE